MTWTGSVALLSFRVPSSVRRTDGALMFSSKLLKTSGTEQRDDPRFPSEKPRALSMPLT